MQAIVTKYLPPTNVRGGRIKAWCERGSIVISYPHGASNAHAEAKDALIAKFIAEDAKRYGTNRNPWSDPMVEGGLPKPFGGSVFVFVR
jgi:hypothetical protein